MNSQALNISAILLILIMSVGGCFSAIASSEIDSLENLLKKTEVNDREQVQEVLQHSFELLNSHPREVITILNKIAAIASDQKFEKQHGHAYRLIGMAYLITQEYDKAMSNVLTALKVYEKNNDSKSVRRCYMSLGRIYMGMNMTDSSTTYFKKVLKEALAENDSVGIQYSCLAVGVSYLEGKQLDSAKHYVNRVMQLAEKLKLKQLLGSIYNNMGDISEQNSLYDSSLYYYNKSMEYFVLNNNIAGQVTSLEGIGRVYFKMKRYDLAQLYFHKGLEKVDLVGLKNVKGLIYKGLSDIEKKRGNFQKALELLKTHKIIADSILNEDKLKDIQLLRNKYEFEKKDAEILKLSQDIEILDKDMELRSISQYRWITLFFFLPVIGFVFINLQKKRVRTNRQIYLTQQEVIKAEITKEKLIEKDLELALEFKNKQLTGYTLNFIQKAELINSLKTEITLCREKVSESVKQELDNILVVIEENYDLEEDWRQFFEFFKAVYPNFHGKLINKFDLTKGELKMASLVKLNLNMKECSTILGISFDSVKTFRYRLRKKMDLNREEDISAFLISL